VAWGVGAHLAVLGELGHAQRAVAGLELVRLGVLEPARGELLLERRHLLVARHVAEEVAAVADLHHLQLDHLLLRVGDRLLLGGRGRRGGGAGLGLLLLRVMLPDLEARLLGRLLRRGQLHAVGAAGRRA
jgi:hypothetical protein